MVVPIGRSFYVQTQYGRIKGFRYSASNGNPDAPLIIVQGGISATGQLWRLDGKGWWQSLYPVFAQADNAQVISFDYLGGLGGSDTPVHPLSIAEHTSAYLEALARLGFDTIDAWVGGSFGGVLGLQAATSETLSPQRLVVIGAAHRPSIQSSLLRSFQQLLLQQCANDQHGVILARALAMLSYRSSEEFEQRFNNGDEALEYVLAQGEKLLRQHGRQAEKLFTQLTPVLNDYLINTNDVRCPTQVIGFGSDAVAPPSIVTELHSQLAKAEPLTIIDSLYGHDGFIKNVADFQPLLTDFIPALQAVADTQLQNTQPTTKNYAENH